MTLLKDNAQLTHVCSVLVDHAACCNLHKFECFSICLNIATLEHRVLKYLNLYKLQQVAKSTYITHVR